MAVPAPTPTPREPDGKFSVGNAGGPGRPRGRRVTEGRRAVEEAVTPDMLAAAIRKCALLALQGNLAAMRILFERTLGRPADVPAGEPLEIEPLRLRTAADCTAALQKVTDAIREGRLDVLHGKVLLDAIETQSKLINVGELEARLAELERQAATVDFGRRA